MRLLWRGLLPGNYFGLVADVAFPVEQGEEDMPAADLHVEGADGAAALGPAAWDELFVVGEFSQLTTALVIGGTGLKIGGPIAGGDLS